LASTDDTTVEEVGVENLGVHAAGVTDQTILPVGEIERRRMLAAGLGGPERIEREHRSGRLTVRERLELLLDSGSFQEIGTFAVTPMEAADGELVSVFPAAFVCGFGRIEGRRVVVGGEDYSIQGGSASIHLEKLKGSWAGYVEDLAYESRVPLVLLMQGAGGSVSLQSAVGYPYMATSVSTEPILDLLNRVPVAVAAMGPVAGSGAARVVSSHFSIMRAGQACMFAGGPPLVERALGMKVDKLELGGVDVHVRAAGNVDNLADTEAGVFAQIRTFLSYLPSSVDELPLGVAGRAPAVSGAELEDIAGDVPGSRYDVRRIVAGLVDEGTFFEIGGEFGESLVTGLGRVDGRPVGILANDVSHASGAMTGLSADKQVRLVQVCDTFHLPIVYIVDTPGLLDDESGESSGVLRRAVRAMGTLHRATVPVLTVQIGRSGGLAGLATASPSHLPLRFAWPTATVLDEAIPAATEPTGRLWATVESFGLEEVIEPAATRATVAAWLALRCESLRPGPKAGAQFRP
jgi:methylmalonyl-CoA decarboxylase subunit alpha